MLSPAGAHRGRAGRAAAAAVLALVAAALLAGCGPKKNRPVTQTAARVNKDPITLQQLGFVMQQLNIKPEQAAAERQVLERLIDQQLALQRVDELKLERDPRTVQQLEAARREILARAYFDRVADAAPRPTDEDIRRHYDDKPALFKQRRIYSLQEFAVEGTSQQVAALREQLAQAADLNGIVEVLRRSGLRFGANLALRAAEQLPPQSLEALARMKDGDHVLTPTPSGALVLVLAGSRDQPLSEAQARTAIEQILLAERRRRLVEDELRALRAAARIEYLGKFAAPAAAASRP